MPAQQVPAGFTLEPPPAAAPPAAPAGFTLEEPTFRSSNARDASGAPVVLPSAGDMASTLFQGGPLGVNAAGMLALRKLAPKLAAPIDEFLSHVREQVDPVKAVGALASMRPKSMGGQGADVLKAIGKAQGALYDKAKASYEKDDYVGAATHFVNYLLPIVGPAIDQAGDLFKAGKWAAGSGDSIGIGLAMFAPEALRELVPKAPPKPLKGSSLTPPPDPVIQFARDRGVLLDAATATGSPTLRAAQKRVGNVLGGEGTARTAIGTQVEDLTRVGGELADEAKPGAVSPEQAGQGIRDAITSTIKSLHARANEAYAKLRDIEARPDSATEVPDASRTAPVKARQAIEESTAGRVVSGAERSELRRMLEELENIEYQDKTYTEAGRGRGGDLEVRGRRPNAPVYHDIEGELGYEASADSMKADIRAALNSGNYRAGGKAALEVARKRAAGLVTDKPGVIAGKVSKPVLPMGPGFDEPTGSTRSMQLAVDLRDVKAAVQPIYDRLKREGELAPLMGDKAQALRALDRVVNGPDHAPLSVADAALGELKALARTDGVQELRGSGKGIAAAAVRQLDEAVQMHAAAAGDDVANALQAGRKATRAKYAAGDLLDRLRDEPVKVYAQMTAPRDGGIKLLRQVRDMAPDKMADVARAWLQERLDTATRRQGKFLGADRMSADWAKLGKETKAILFPKAGQAQALDHFFELARRIAENPNPSGTAHTSLVFDLPASVGAYPLAKLLYTPGGVRAVTRVLSFELPDVASRAGRGVATGAPRAAAWANLVEVAKSVGVDLPKAADRDAQK